MSMNQEQENFENVRRLVALKRHEQPPPGYFHHFSGNVISRIRAGELGDDVRFANARAGVASWLQRFWAAVESKPALAGGLGMALCAFLVTGIVISGQNENTALTTEMPLSTPATVAQRPFAPSAFGEAPVALSSTAPVIDSQPAGSLFDDFRRIQPVPPSYQILPVSFRPNQ
jgi:hypothetical protein